LIHHGWTWWSVDVIYKGWADILLTGEIVEGATVVRATGMLVPFWLVLVVGEAVTREVGSIVGKVMHAARAFDLVFDVVVPDGQKIQSL
jgi:hypothetical protein